MYDPIPQERTRNNIYEKHLSTETVEDKLKVFRLFKKHTHKKIYIHVGIHSLSVLKKVFVI